MKPRPFPLMRWGFVFLSSPSWLTEEQRRDLVMLALQAWATKQPKIHFDWEGLQGDVKVTSDEVALGAFTGQRFSAEVWRAEGPGRVEFLIAEKQLTLAREQAAEA